MKTHPLKLISIGSIFGLMLSQLGLLFWLESTYSILIGMGLILPLLLPVKGLIIERRYTYKWVGFLALVYICIGISESFSSPDLRLYGMLTIAFSAALFISSVYYSRYLRRPHME